MDKSTKYHQRKESEEQAFIRDRKGPKMEDNDRGYRQFPFLIVGPGAPAASTWCRRVIRNTTVVRGSGSV